MRQLFLVIVLVAASFLGGAFVNGPGLQWVQTRVVRSLGLNNGGEIASVDLKSTTSAEINSNVSASAKVETDATREPTVPLSSLLTEEKSHKEDTSDRRLSFQTGDKSGAKDLLPSRSRPMVTASSAKDPKALHQSPSRASNPSDDGVTPASAEYSSRLRR